MLTPLELTIMNSIWHRGSATVREVQADLLPERRLAYTTVMTVMDRLFKKGTLRREKRSRAHVYEATITSSEVRSEAVEGLLESFFGGSRQRLRSYLGGEHGAVRSVEPKVAPHPIDDSLL
jgi:predicted transcriptional regulator